MYSGRLKKIKKEENKITRKEMKAIKLYDKVRKMETKYNLVMEDCKNDKEKFHNYKIQLYRDVELRNDIVNEAVNEYNYPEEDTLEIFKYLTESLKWNNNVNKNEVDKFLDLEIYIIEMKKKISIHQKIGAFFLNLFSSIGGDH